MSDVIMKDLTPLRLRIYLDTSEALYTLCSARRLSIVISCFIWLSAVLLSLQSLLAYGQLDEKLVIGIRQEISRLATQYQAQEVVQGAAGSMVIPDEYALEELKQRIYRTANHKRVRIDYYKSWLFGLKEKFLGREINIYSDIDKEHLKYSVWLDEEQSIQTVLEWGVITKTKEGHKEYIKQVDAYYNGMGKLRKRSVIITTIDHQKHAALYVRSVLDASGNVISTESGDVDYDQYSCPKENQHCL